MKKTKKAFTLIELIVGMVIALILMSAAFIFFSYGYRQMDKTMKDSKGNISIFSVVEIIDSDLRKAGYGSVSDAGYSPVSGEGTEANPLTIRFVDYTNPICDNETWTIDNSCSYIIEYYLKDSNIYRYVDKGANGTGSSAPMFDENLVTVDSFNVTVNDTAHTVSYNLIGKIKDRTFSIGDEVICRNW